MCARIQNLKSKHRTRLEFPHGGTCNPQELESHFGDITPAERGTLSRTVLNALPRQEREAIGIWVNRKASHDDMPKHGPTDPALQELLVFYAISHHARSNQKTVRDTVANIVDQRSAVGIILRAA